MKQQRRVLDASDGNLREVGSYIPTVQTSRMLPQPRLAPPPPGYTFYNDYQPDNGPYEQVRIPTSNGQTQQIPVRSNPQYVQQSASYNPQPQQMSTFNAPKQQQKVGKSYNPQHAPSTTTTNHATENISTSFADQELKGFLIKEGDSMDEIYKNNAGRIKFILE